MCKMVADKGHQFSNYSGIQSTKQAANQTSKTHQGQTTCPHALDVHVDPTPRQAHNRRRHTIRPLNEAHVRSHGGVKVYEASNPLALQQQRKCACVSETVTKWGGKTGITICVPPSSGCRSLPVAGVSAHNKLCQYTIE
jgi:hypothetical protein